EAPAWKSEAARELLGDDDPVLGRRREVRAELDPLPHRPDDRGMAVALDHRAEAVVEIDVLRPVDVPDARAPAVGQVDRPWVAVLVRRRDAARERPARPLVERARAGRPLVEPALLPLGQLRDAGSVELDGRALGHALRILAGPAAACGGRGKIRRWSGISGPCSSRARSRSSARRTTRRSG